MPENVPPVWPEEKVEAAKELLKLGYSAAMVGCEIGASRNAVIGKMMRLGIKISTLNGHIQKRGRPRSKPMERPVLKYRNPNMPRGVARTATPKPPPVLNLIPSTACGIMQLNFHTCHWPLWQSRENRLYCGAPVDGKTYCADHWRMATKSPYEKRLPKQFFRMTHRPAKAKSIKA